MTKTKVLKKFFKKFFNYDATGNSSTQVINDFVENNENISGGGGGILAITTLYNPMTCECSKANYTSIDICDATDKFMCPILFLDSKLFGAPLLIPCLFTDAGYISDEHGDNKLVITFKEEFVNHDTIYFRVWEDGSVTKYVP